MRLGWIALIVGLGTIAMGGQALYEARAAGAEKDIAYARYKVTGARWSPVDAVTLQGLTGATAEDVYVRFLVDGMDGGDDAPTKLLVHVRDQKLADQSDFEADGIIR